MKELVDDMCIFLASTFDVVMICCWWNIWKLEEGNSKISFFFFFYNVDIFKFFNEPSGKKNNSRATTKNNSLLLKIYDKYDNTLKTLFCPWVTLFLGSNLPIFFGVTCLWLIKRKCF